MSIRHGLLALLEPGPRYGFQLRSEFESRTGSTWPLNVGQVYTTLSRLERDGLVAPAGVDEGGHPLYAITEAGRTELRAWFDTPVDRANPPRNELAIKLAMAVGSPEVDVRAVIQAQRVHTMKAMQDYTRLKARSMGTAIRGEDPLDVDSLTWELVLDQMIYQAEAEARWLDHCETRLARLPGTTARPARAAEETLTAQDDAPAARDAGGEPGSGQDDEPRSRLARPRGRR
ncbi:PadR family transcriptional regulator [Streptomyces avermitilis]|uniref:PadR family transcriptional regulator n=1 Tax=Streptomyces avermitilis TaxID=33903 RepID=UPI003808E8A7